MAARGTIAKNEIANKILNTFEGSFSCDGGKVIRIPFEENGEIVEVKVSLVAAKDTLGGGEASVSAALMQKSADNGGFPEPIQKIAPTDEEKQRVKDLINSLNL